jgi:transcriptional regulator with XRE-family HTH domain
MPAADAAGQARSVIARVESMARRKAPTPAPTLASLLGRQIESLRLAAGLTASAVAKKAGLSNSMYSRVERGMSSPSVDSIDRIAGALGVPVSKLFLDQSRRSDCSYVPAGKGLKVNRIGSTAGHEYELLGHLLSGNLFVEPYRVSLLTGAEPCSTFQHTGVEFLFVISGSMQYRYGERRFALKPGDSLLFDAAAQHGPEKFGASSVSYLSVVFNMRS